jgi:hypothetical protein
MAQALGLHRDSLDILVPAHLREERLKVFWVCYVMDKTISMAVGRSSALHDFDCDVPLPPVQEGNPATEPSNEHNSDKAVRLSTDERTQGTFFVHTIKLAQIISKVYMQLYSAQAVTRRAMDSLADTVGDLDMELMNWRNTIPEEFRPECDVQWKSDVLYQHVLYLHLGYYNCLYNIHRSVYSIRFGPTPDSHLIPDRPLRVLRRNRVYGSAALSTGAARTCLRLCLRLVQTCPDLICLPIW